MLADRLDPEAALAFAAASVAAETAGWGDGAVDDLVLLRGLLETADDDLLKVMGPHLRTVLSALAGVGAPESRRLPFAEHLLDAALNEAIDLNGSADVITAVHLVLGLFFFPGCAATKVLQSCGIDWRPLRSLTRRLTGRSFYDW
ncbi:MAG TPA: hypothetical protein VM143_02000 [Acidimicrobiales bacterium]|nr:hypothetical protein [Acidimicrobiales bacterium]